MSVPAAIDLIVARRNVTPNRAVAQVATVSTPFHEHRQCTAVPSVQGHSQQ